MPNIGEQLVKLLLIKDVAQGIVDDIETLQDGLDNLDNGTITTLANTLPAIPENTVILTEV